MKSKIAIIGAGSVGCTLAYNLSLKGTVTEIALIDTNREKAEAEILDITQGAPLGKSLNLYAADYRECRDAGLAVITAGARQRPGETRVELLARNAGIMKAITRSILESGFEGIFLVITNPVDVLTYITFAESGFPVTRVIGSGTILDSARLREYIARHCRVSPLNVHGYVLGEHGDTSFTAWSMLTVGGTHLTEYCPVCGQDCDLVGLKYKAQEQVRQAADRIIQAKGSTYYAIAQAASVLIESIVRDERRILPISTVRQSFKGIERTAFSFPTIVGEEGAAQVLDFELPEEEERSLLSSARFVAENIARAGY